MRVSFKSVVASNTRQISPSERRVMNVLLSATNASEITAAEIASRSQTHESTVVRLAQKLGYRGYPDLRADLQRDEGSHVESVPVMRASTGHDLLAFATDEAASLERLARYIPQESLDSAAGAIHAARTVYLYSSADERAALDLLAGRLRRLGLVVVTLGYGGKDLAEHFVSFDATSVLVALALREAPTSLPTLVSEAQRRGGAAILVTDTPGYHFRPAPDHLLASPRGFDSEYNTLVVPIVIAYALQLAVFHLDPTRYGAVRSDIDDLTRLVGGADEIPLRP
ncbi:MurR/RpiR family transcriptional regulator [Rathayibacter caricis DSM 15933]|uniref:MurR/RpiR family transcriptional regulator n=1 Tax=Rathayibacter caricis DSM 15933 TaxID=1328867 RepID=A0A2T4URF9_9MICO|nr:hypothetical protein ASF48_16530 [Rathayibacter sp. Leaf299]PTL72118.1 MurR/RpiR family transcriptional regulator [Rathayibacter caricis DSM 15933]